MSSEILYRVKHYEKHFESAERQKIKKPVKSFAICDISSQDFRRIFAERDGHVLHSMWILLTNFLSCMESPREGYVTHNGQKTGKPLDAESLSFQLRATKKKCQRFLDFFSDPEISWLEQTGRDHGTCPVQLRSLNRFSSGEEPDVIRTNARVREEKLREGKVEREGAGSISDHPAVLAWVELTGVELTGDQVELVERTVGGPERLEKYLAYWRYVIGLWGERYQFHRGSLQGVIDWFLQGKVSKGDRSRWGVGVDGSGRYGVEGLFVPDGRGQVDDVDCVDVVDGVER